MVPGYQKGVLWRSFLKKSTVSSDRTIVAKSLPTGRTVGRSYLGQRLDFLRKSQNPDGGWGYFPGKASWLEPTAYAAMALHGDPAADRAWKLLMSWQSNGGWRSSASVQEPGWGTSLCVSLAQGRGDAPAAVVSGVNWLVNSVGAETNWLGILLGYFRHERDLRLKAWPWKPGDSGWVEPTAHALVALKQVARTSAVHDRIQSGEAQLLDVRSSDGGWNYGARAALGVDLPSYPETTALALLGLQGRNSLDSAFDLAARQLMETPSPLGRGWLSIALRLHGRPAFQDAASSEISTDIMLASVEALAAPDGNFWFMKAA